MAHQNSEAARAQVRKHLKVRPVAPQHPQARLEISLRLTGTGGQALIVPVVDTVSLARPLDPLVRELNLSQATGCLNAAVAMFLRSYDELLQPVAKEAKPAPAGRSVVAPIGPTAGNNCLPQAAPTWIDAIAISKVKIEKLREPSFIKIN